MATGMYAPFITPIKSVYDWQDEAAQREMAAQAFAQRNALAEMQMAGMRDQQRRAAEQDAKSGRINALARMFYTPENAPGDGMGPVMPGGFDAQGFGNALMAEDPMAGMEWMRATRPEQRGPMNVAPGGSVFDPNTGRVIYRADFKPEDPPAPTELERAQMLRSRLKLGTPEYEEASALIRRLTTPPGPQTVVLGAPVPVQLPDGSTGFAQPANRPGSAPQILTGPDGKPLKRPEPEGANKVGAEIQRMNIAADAMDKLLTEYEEMLKKHNPRDPTVQMSPRIRADITALQKNIQLQFKELQALGALAGPDLGIMEAALASPFSMQGAFYGRDGLMAQIRRARELVRVRKEAVAANPQSGKPPAPNNDPLGLRGGK